MERIADTKMPEIRHLSADGLRRLCSFPLLRSLPQLHILFRRIKTKEIVSSNKEWLRYIASLSASGDSCGLLRMWFGPICGWGEQGGMEVRGGVGAHRHLGAVL